MTDPTVPEPTVRDEELALEFIRIKDATDLQGVPSSDGAGADQRDVACRTCHFYADTDRAISYCWHDELEIMVGGRWWCDRWEAIGEPDREMSPEQVTESRRLWHGLVERNQWVDEPRSGEQCNGCLYYLSPDDSVSYCWHPGLQVGVGFDHRCTWWEEIPGDG